MNGQINYDLEMQTVIKGCENRKKLLLHSCCGPCSTACLERLTPYFDITVFCFNPNIMPYAEYEKRKESQRVVCGFFGVEMLEGEYINEQFLSAVKGMESLPEGGKRCRVCFDLRLRQTAIEAKVNGFDFFATTLTVSPHKNAPIINDIGFDIAKEIGVNFLPSDFKKRNGFKRSIELSNNLGLYRQDYCGCRL